VASGFPTTTGSTPLTLNEGLTIARNIATQIKLQVVNVLLPGAQTNGISSQVLLQMPQTYTNWIATLNSAAAISGMAAYAQAQLNNDVNIATQFSVMISAITAVVNWIDANFPSTDGYLEYAQLNAATGLVSYVTFTPTQLAGLVPLLQALQAALD
jgi:hypothetical protein